jgi:catechol 2,3-dioxygenase-like lactoylglutathione lyase family enzyme
MAEFPAITHVALTVTDCDASAEWYSRLFGSKPVLDEMMTDTIRHVVFALGGGTLVGLHGHQASDGSDRFAEERLGLDHIAFACANRAELEQWQARLDELGIAHGGIVDAHYGSGLSFRDPDNIALEFFAPPA